MTEKISPETRLDALRDELSRLPDEATAERAALHVQLAWETPLFLHAHAQVYGDLLEARDLAEASQLPPEVRERLQVRLALCELQQARFDEARARLDRLGTEAAARPLVAAAMARVVAASDDEAPLPAAPDLAEREAARLWRWAQVERSFRRQRLAEAVGDVEALYRLGRERGPAADDAVHFACQSLAMLAQLREDGADAVRWHRRALVAAERWGAAHEDLQARFPLGNLLFARGEREEALELFEEGARLARERDLGAQEAMFAEGLARLHTVGERWGDARVWSERALALAHEQDNPAGVVAASAMLASSHLEQGRHKDGYRVVVRGACAAEAAGESELANLLWRVRDRIREIMGQAAFQRMAAELYEEEAARAAGARGEGDQ